MFIMIFIFDTMPKFEKGNWTIDTVIDDHYQAIIIPHQLIIRWKNFWGAELQVIKTNEKTTPQPVGGNQAICNKVAEYITNNFKSLDTINEELHRDGYNLHNDIDLKTVYWALLSSKNFNINLERNKNWEIRKIPAKPLPKNKTKLFTCKRVNNRLTNIKVKFPEYFMAKRHLIINQKYNDDTTIQLSIDIYRGLFIDIRYQNHEYHEMRQFINL